MYRELELSRILKDNINYSEYKHILEFIMTSMAKDLLNDILKEVKKGEEIKLIFKAEIE